MSSTRIVSAFAAGIVLPSAILVGVSSPAMADDAAPAATPAVEPAAAPAPGPAAPAPHVPSVRELTIARYGIYPLPVTERHIKRYHLRKKILRQIAAAHKLSNTAEGRKIRRLESGTNYKYNDGHYFGAWNFDRGTWLSNGGGRFARTADKAPRWAQDYIAWKTHKSRGWSPWSTA